MKEIREWYIQTETANPYIRPDQHIKANVPGDITDDLFCAGIIEDPYYGLNYKNQSWIAEQDFTYTAHFDIDDETHANEEVHLVFESVDLFADVYLNGVKIGKTENMFRKYTFEVKQHLKENGNILQVKLFSTIKAMKEINAEGYFGIFNAERIFLRKSQCHFGWDWAPKISGYGICGKVYLEGVHKCRIDDVTYQALNDGRITFVTELNYSVCPLIDGMGYVVENSSVPKLDDKLVIAVENLPGSGVYIEKTIEVTGKKSFVNFTITDPQLWWPNGYGKQPMYNYKVVLFRGGCAVSEKTGRFAFREVKLVKEPKGERFHGFEFFINGKKVFAKGSNWVPADCLSGRIPDEKYKKLVKLAADGNMNMLRVWGGGMYEKDVFYDTCDELGILVWQDFMLACSDSPENNSAWENNFLQECEYQIKRLRNHPSIIYWCGGNEMMGTYLCQIGKGKFFIDYILPGIVSRMDSTRPYGYQSPSSITAYGVDEESGDCHCSSYEVPYYNWRSTGNTAILQYRKYVSKKVMGFLSECALMGINSLETNRKIYPVDKQWPLNEYWEDRFRCNPHDGCGGFFFSRKLEMYVRDMYGQPNSMEEFVAKGMMLNSEFMRAELEWVRAHKPLTAGFLNWMYSEIWPCGTWNVIDYYTEPKQVYYQMKRSFRQILATFFEDADGVTKLFVDNDSDQAVALEITYGVRTFAGKTLESKKFWIHMEAGEVCQKVADFHVDCKSAYLFVQYSDGTTTQSNVYSPDFWRSAELIGTYTVEPIVMEPCKVQLKIKANGFVKGLFIHIPDNYKYSYSDNYLDIEDGQEVIVEVTADEPIDLQQLSTTDYSHSIMKQ